jgi:hypothetical protein
MKERTDNCPWLPQPQEYDNACHMYKSRCIPIFIALANKKATIMVSTTSKRREQTYQYT